MSKPKILYFDIETSPIITAAFRLGKQHVAYDQVLKRSQVMCISWAWDNGKVQCRSFDLDQYDWYEKDDESDLELLKEFQALSMEADLVVAHNGKKFDVAVLRSRLIRHGLPDLKPFLIDDTYLLSKDIGFMSHKQDDLGELLQVGRKMPHGTGMEWWIDIIRGNHDTLTKMMRYCMTDVSRLRDIYKKLKPYVRSNLNMAIVKHDREACRNCGKKTLQARGYAFTQAGKKQRYQCTDCGVWQTDGKNLIKVPSNYPR